MRSIFALVLIVGVALAGAAVYLTQGYINQTQAELDEQKRIRDQIGDLVEVFVVNEDVAYGGVLTKEMVQPAYIQKAMLPEGAFTDLAVLFPEDMSEKKRFILREMEKFEVVLDAKITAPGELAGPTSALSKGMRAFAIKVEAADFLQPTDRVDIYWTGSDELGNSEVTRLIGAALEVVSVNRAEEEGLAGGDIKKRTITVAADPKQIAVLAQGQATGRLVMSLVGMGDETETGMVEVDAKELLGVVEQTVVVKGEPMKVCSVRTRKGAEVLDVEIPCTN